MIHMHKRARPYPSMLALCGLELAPRYWRQYLTTADRHVSCPHCLRLIANIDEEKAREQLAKDIFG